MSIAKIKGGGGGDNAKRGCDDAGNCDGDSDGNPIVQPQHPFKRGSPHWDGHWMVTCACCWMADIDDSRCRRWPMSTTETATTMADVDTRPRLPARQRHHPLLPLPANIDDGQC